MKKIITTLLFCGCVVAAESPSTNTATRNVPPPPRKMLYLSAKEMERVGKYDEAKAVYRMAINNGVIGDAKDEAFLGLARCEEKQENFWLAFLAIESSFPERDALLNLPAEERAKALLLRVNLQWQIAGELEKIGTEIVADAVDKKNKKLNGFSAAAEIYHAIIYNHPKSDVARSAFIRRGFCLRQIGDFTEAEKTYRMLINTFPDAPEVAEAKIGLAALLAEKTHEKGGLRGREQSETTDIVRNAKTLTDKRPELQEQVEYAQTAIEENEAAALLQQAKEYLKRGGRKSNSAAIFLLEDIYKRYPNTAAANEAKTYLQ